MGGETGHRIARPYVERMVAMPRLLCRSSIEMDGVEMDIVEMDIVEMDIVVTRVDILFVNAVVLSV